MPELIVDIHATAPDGRFITVPELVDDPALLGSLNLKDRPDGGLTITDNAFLVLVEDSLADVAAFFLDDLPPLLRAGQGSAYKFRTGPETTKVVIQGEDAVIVGYDGDELRTTVAALLQGLDAARQDYATLRHLGRM